MSVETEADAARLVEKYEHVLAFCCAKAWYKWRSYVRASGHHAAFEFEDIRQLALEALLLFGGCMPEHTRKSQSGTLAQVEAEGGEKYVQRQIDLYVSSALLKLVEKSRASIRGGDMPPPKSLDAPVPGMLDRTEPIEHDGALESNHVALPDLPKRYPILYLLEVETYDYEEARALVGLDVLDFERQRKEELAAFTEWAAANRRVTEGAKPRRRRKPCPYNEPSCTGVHVRSAPADKQCPGVKEKRAAERSVWNAKRSERRARARAAAEAERPGRTA